MPVPLPRKHSEASGSSERCDTKTSRSGLASPVNDLLIMKDGKAVPPGEIGEVWIRGPNVMKGYWRDQGMSSDGIPSQPGLTMLQPPPTRSSPRMDVSRYILKR
jgi:acyl-CoA synthetase (AMP-forming)/AMP-acid ligase II